MLTLLIRGTQLCDAKLVHSGTVESFDCWRRFRSHSCTMSCIASGLHKCVQLAFCAHWK